MTRKLFICLEFEEEKEKNTGYQKSRPVLLEKVSSYYLPGIVTSSHTNVKSSPALKKFIWTLEEGAKAKTVL